MKLDFEWEPMERAPRDGASFVVYDGSELMVVHWSEYANAKGGWWLPEGAVINYEDCKYWWPIPPLRT